jgi:hypothetical protein
MAPRNSNTAAMATADHMDSVLEPAAASTRCQHEGLDQCLQATRHYREDRTGCMRQNTAQESPDMTWAWMQLRSCAIFLSETHPLRCRRHWPHHWRQYHMRQTKRRCHG